MENYKLLFNLEAYPERTEEEQSIPNEIWYRDQDIKILIEDRKVMLNDILMLTKNRDDILSELEILRPKANKIITI